MSSKTVKLFFSLFGLFLLTDAVEWYGDLRAHMNPPKSPPFYDVVYDDSDCPFGLESVAIPEFVYFGEMIATKSVREHSACLQFCLETPRCKAVNFFESLSKKDLGTGFCELLVESQYDNPRLMRPFKKATYYEKIHCREGSGEEDQPFIFNANNGKEMLAGENNNKSSATKNEGPAAEGENEPNKRPAALRKNHRKTSQQQKGQRNGTLAHSHGTEQRKNQNETEETTLIRTEKVLTLKKLAEKVQEFNERFRS